ncbi:ABC transporter substrate-binding protein [Pelagibacterium sp. 26DY04]|uniref:heme/hemin ABC transporter substrate-binding protein n=1 Tax=Pelagibacterium sp. 26DY04 TaxID=2967130 RepID=UPI0028155B54|nr:ABC transporter substrate-binding protein [Pelagibacterium sp. 26DY04]WMT87673.1 ABC transporter substrate-binding protein [Pelagibacterium sp. 26DY04]
MRHILLALTVFSAPALALGQEITPFEDPSRLVTIGGSLTEIVFELGAEDYLVARDSTGTYPEAAAELPDVGYMRALAPEGVLSVEPTALLMLEGAGPLEALEVLQSASVPIVTVPESYDAAGVAAKVEMVGAALGVNEEAEALNARIAADFAAVEELTAEINERKSVLFILSMAGGRLNASGTGTAADGIIALAGADNAITEYEGYRQLTEEAIINANPDVILMMDRGGDHAVNDAELLDHPAVSLTTAGQTGAIIRMEGEYLLGFGPRAASAARELSQAIYAGED